MLGTPCVGGVPSALQRESKCPNALQRTPPFRASTPVLLLQKRFARICCCFVFSRANTVPFSGTCIRLRFFAMQDSGFSRRQPQNAPSVDDMRANIRAFIQSCPPTTKNRARQHHIQISKKLQPESFDALLSARAASSSALVSSGGSVASSLRCIALNCSPRNEVSLSCSPRSAKLGESLMGVFARIYRSDVPLKCNSKHSFCSNDIISRQRL